MYTPYTVGHPNSKEEGRSDHPTSTGSHDGLILGGVMVISKADSIVVRCRSVALHHIIVIPCVMSCGD